MHCCKDMYRGDVNDIGLRLLYCWLKVCVLGCSYSLTYTIRFRSTSIVIFKISWQMVAQVYAIALNAFHRYTMNMSYKLNTYLCWVVIGRCYQCNLLRFRRYVYFRLFDSQNADASSPVCIVRHGYFNLKF